MSITEAISVCFAKYAIFEGRARRSEYWWWVLFIVVVSVVLQLVTIKASSMGAIGGGLALLFSLATLLPGLAVSVRRLHDTGRSGWWLLLSFVPVIGTLVLLYFMCQQGTQGPNQFGNGMAMT